MHSITANDCCKIPRHHTIADYVLRQKSFSTPEFSRSVVEIYITFLIAKAILNKIHDKS